MRLLLFILAATLLFTACRKTHNNVTPQVWERDWVYAPGFEIVIVKDTVNGKARTNYGMLKQSNNLVFQFEYKRGHNNDIVDDEYMSKVGFEISPSVTSFSYANEELAKAKAHYMGGGAWAGYGSVGLTNGTIKGHKTGDSTWYVEMDVTLPEKDPNSGLYHITERAAYRLSYYW